MAGSSSGKSSSVKVNTVKSSAMKAARPKGEVATSSETLSASMRIDMLIAGLDDWRGERLAEIRSLIHEVDPDVVEDWKWMGTPVWSHDGMYVLANAHKQKVKITFFHGARLPDTNNLFNSDLEGNKWRAIDLYETDTINKPALSALLRLAVEYNRTHRVPRSRGSRRKKM